MSKSTLKLYTSTSSNPWKLVASKLFKVEDIASYLAQFTPITINDFQYQKNALELEIKVDISQADSQPTSLEGYKYVSIQNDGEKIAYYYVRRASWRSSNTIRFELVMDVLNTFTDGTDYLFKANTRIIREHKNRFSRKLWNRYVSILIANYTEGVEGTPSVGDRVQWTYSFDGETYTTLDLDFEVVEIYFDPENEECSIKMAILNSNKTDEEILEELETSVGYITAIESFSHPRDYNVSGILDSLSNITHTYRAYRNIDYVNENINPILNCGNSNGLLLEDDEPLDDDWYLLYRNQNDPSESLVNPVDCFLIPGTSKNTDASYIQSGRLIPSWLEDGKWYFFLVKSGATYTLSNGASATYFDASNKRILMITKAGEKISVINFLVSNSSTGGYDIVWQYDDIEYIDITNLPANYNYYSSSPHLDWSYLNSMSFPYSFNNSGSLSKLDPITALDRTDSKNIKLIKLPYIPSDIQVSGTTLQIASSDTWEYVSISQVSGAGFKCLKLKNLNSKLTRGLVMSGNDSPLKIFKRTDFEPDINDLRIPQIDSKLYHSEFYQPKFVYDSFSFSFDLEKYNPESYFDTQALSIKFIMSRTINSRFMFEMSNLDFKIADTNYPKYMPITRNNEEVLYNVPYINYIRNGFNYDVKAKNMANASNWAGVGLSVASIGASLLAPSVPLKLAGVVASVVSMAVSVKSAITSTLQGEETLKQKILQTQNQTASVAGSDDVDLMSEYSQNRLKYLVYEPHSNMKNLLEQLFYYAGYNSGRMGIPTHNNRVNFDYLECDASFEDNGANIPQEIMDEIKNCFKAGVTYIHKTSRSNPNKWDIEQKYENWETTLMED